MDSDFSETEYCDDPRVMTSPYRQLWSLMGNYTRDEHITTVTIVPRSIRTSTRAPGPRQQYPVWRTYRICSRVRGICIDGPLW